jgi:putative tricarboxylic transport membrane protein
MSADSPTPDETGRPVVSLHTADIVVSLLLLAAGIVLALENWRIGARWAAEGPQTGFFPFYLALILIGASAWGLLTAALAGKGDGGSFVDQDQLKRVMQVLIPTIIYVVALKYCGIYVSSALLVFAFMRFLGDSSWWASILTGVVFSGIIFWLFEIQFRVVLPKGPIEAYFGF